MRLDEFWTIITDEPWPGNGGDSCANTARYAIAAAVDESGTVVNLSAFRTNTGYVRHPMSPTCAPVTCEDWTATFTSDQAIPLLMAYEVTGRAWLAEEMRQRVKWHTSPGKRSHVVLTLLAYRLWFAVVIAQFVQFLLFLIPIRWSDDRRLDGRLLKFVWSKGSSSDFLNYAAIGEFLWLVGYKRSSRLLLRLGERIGLTKKIIQHHKIDPSENELVLIQVRAIKRILWS